MPSYFRSKNVLFILTFCTFHFADYICQFIQPEMPTSILDEVKE
nr:MAG TPA: hypothetical protein [Caudoviricetes sp.]